MDTSQLKTRAFLFATTLASAFSFLACSPPQSNLREPPPAKSGTGLNAATFGEVKKLVFDPKCLACHTSGTTNLTSRITLLAGTSVIPGNPDRSPLYRRVADGSMPRGGPSLDPDQVSLIYDWIASGAVDDEPGTQNPQQPPPGGPQAPDAMTAIAISSTQIKLVWTDNAADETGFKIERSEQPDTGFRQIALTAPDIQQFFDDGLTAPATYYYRVSAVGEGGESEPTNVASAMISP